MANSNLLFILIVGIILPSLMISSMVNGQTDPTNSKEKNKISTKSQTPLNLTKALIDSQSAKNLTSIDTQRKKPSGYFSGDSIKIFTVLNMYSIEQWSPIDNYTSHGWEIKLILPATIFQSTGKPFLFVVLEKIPSK